MTSSTPKILLYTNHLCPWAQRAHIALAELDIPYEEEIIDLGVPRTAEYLKINPRGLVPTLSFNGELITESAIVATFLADAFPSKLWPESTDPQGPLTRARITFFVDTYISKANIYLFKLLGAKNEDEERAVAKDYVDAVVKEVEPLLTNAAPFFGGSSTLTLAEVLTGSLVIRLYTIVKHGIISATILDDLAVKAPNFDKWAREVSKHPSVRSKYNEDEVAEATKARIAKMKAST